MPDAKSQLTSNPGYSAHDKHVIRQIWEDQTTPATVLVVLLLDAYGPDAVSWSPATIVMELAYDLGVQVSPAALSKLMAGIQVSTNDDFYYNLVSFNELSAALAGHHQPGIFVMADCGDAAAAMVEVLLLNPPEDTNKEPFSDDVRALLSAMLQEEGIMVPPDILRIATHDLDQAEKVRYDFADDPEMFSGIWKAEESKTQDINNYVRGRLTHIIRDLEQLPLIRGSTSQVAARLLKALPAQ